MIDLGRYLMGVMALVSFFPATSKEIDVLCACTPGAYKITFDFASVCMGNETTGGIDSSYCVIEAVESITDLLPVVVNFVTVIELGQDALVVAQQNYSEPLLDGDSIDYVSIVSDDNSVLPKAIQLNVYGQNADGDEIVNILLVSFTNDCSVYPVIEGYSQGWAVFEELDSPPEGVCTAFDDIGVPTLPPTMAPTEAAVSPTIAPSMAPVDVTVPPTLAPVEATPAPTMSPITSAPTPVYSMSMDLSLSMSMGYGELDSMLGGMMDDLDDYGMGVPKAKDGKKGKKGTKVNGKGGKHEKSNKKSTPPRKKREPTVPAEESQNEAKTKNGAERRRRLRIHRINP